MTSEEIRDRWQAGVDDHKVFVFSNMVRLEMECPNGSSKVASP